LIEKIDRIDSSIDIDSNDSIRFFEYFVPKGLGKGIEHDK
jgi:hypothetical protein